MTTLDDLKKQAALKAVEYVQSGMVVGLGTGSTAVHATRAFGEMLANGRHYIRMSLAKPQAQLQEALARMKGVLTKSD